MTTKNVQQFIKLKYNIFIDSDKLEQINKQINERSRRKRKV